MSSELNTSQRRIVTVKAEIRADNDKVMLTGKPIVYDSWSLPIAGYFRERIRPGAFDECLAGPHDILCLRDHKDEWILGRESAGTFRIKPVPDGIEIECDAPRTTYGLDLVESVRRGDIKGMSFKFDVVTDDWYLEDGKRSRDVIKALLFEVSYLADPAYPETQAGIRDRKAMEDEVMSKCRASNTELAWRRLKLLTIR